MGLVLYQFLGMTNQSLDTQKSYTIQFQKYMIIPIQSNEASLGQEETFLETFLEKIILLEETDKRNREELPSSPNARPLFFFVDLV